jgi:NAD(P)-dependent dehydrogenase (short-subunit alcohol dehydrogenase family)
METVVITGANRGIGLGLTRCFAAAGHHVVAACRQPDEADALRALAGNVEVLTLDVGDAGSVDAFAQELGDRSIDVLINNAGIMGGTAQGLADMDYAAWSRTFEINTLAPFRLTTRLLRNLKQAARPRVITVSSQMGAFGLEMGAGMYAYRSSKSAVSKVMQVLALELKPDNIIVCPVHPGWVQTDMGGPNAQITVEQSTAGLFKLVTGLTMAESGRFWTWDGREHVW